MTKKAFNKSEIAARYAVSRRSVEGWMKRGVLPYWRVGNVVRFDPEECDQALRRFHHGSRAFARGPVALPIGSPGPNPTL